MNRSSRAAVGAVGLMAALLAAALRAEDPAKKAKVVKPPWQCLLEGEDAKKVAEQDKQVEQLQKAGKFAEALKVAEALAELRAKVQGADHWEAIDARFAVEAIRCVLRAKKEEQQRYVRAFALQHQADALQAKERYPDAQPLLDQVLAISRDVLEAEHPATAQCYSWVAYNLNIQGKYREAEISFSKALAIHRKVLGEEHPDTATSYSNLAATLNNQGKYAEAERGFQKALTIHRNMQGEEHPLTAASYNNLAANLNAQGKYPEAEAGHRKALAIQRKVLVEEHPDTAYSYNNRATCLEAQGKYREAEEDYGKALSIWRKLLGEEHPNTATVYNNLALNLNFQGKYREAEESLHKALAIRRKILGEEHPHTSQSYNNLSTIFQDQSKYREAEEGYGKALFIRRKVLGEEHPDTAASYNNMANNLSDQGEYRRAEESLRKALAIWRKVLGEEHPYTAISYGNMALSLNAQGTYREAEKAFRKVLTTHLKVLGEEHTYTATSYNNLAYNLHSQGKFEEAEEGYVKALAIRRKVLGEKHPDMALSYSGLARNLLNQGKYKEAEIFYFRAADSFIQARLRGAVTGLEGAAFTSEHSPLLFLAAVLARNGKPADAWQRFEESLARGTLDDFTARLRRPQNERDKQAQITARIDRLQKLIDRVNVAKPTPEQGKHRDELLSQLRQAYDELATFSQDLEKKYGPVAGEVFDVARIQKMLSPDAAFIAWLDLAVQPKAVDPNGEHWAILLRSAGDPVWVRLRGSGDKDAWTDADTKPPIRLREALQSSRGLWELLAQRLRQQRLQPLAKHLEGVSRLIVLPSTALAGVPLEVIADDYTVSYAHSASMYAHLLGRPAPTDKGLLALADPTFQTKPIVEKPLPPHGVLLTLVLPGSNAFRAGLRANDVLLRYGDTELKAPADFKPQPESNDPEKRVTVIVWREGAKRKQPFYMRPGKLGVVLAPEPAPQAVAEQRRLDHWLAASRGDGKWDPLPGTRLEAAALQRLFGDSARLLQKSEASEQRLNELAASGELGKYSYLHLATHGEVNNLFPLRSAVILARDQLPDDKERTDLLTAGRPIPDGRLEADEVLRRWNLHCDLVTLSACQTALGKYERGEGFVGFAQALVLCGTRSVCLSLWKVDDLATALLMERFYQNLLGQRSGLKAPPPKAAALAEAKLWLRTLPRDEVVKRAASLTAGEARGKKATKLPSAEVPPAVAKAKPADCPFAHPHYWAAFILSGHAD